MTIYKAPVEDVGFLLNDVFAFDRYNNLPGFADAAPDVRDAIINEAARLSEEVLHPLNSVGDQQGCTRHDDGSVTTPRGFKEAYKVEESETFRTMTIQETGGTRKTVEAGVKAVMEMLRMFSVVSTQRRVTQDFTMKNCQVFRGVPTWHPILIASDEEKMRAYADPAMLRLVIENLLSNAVKYSRDAEEAVIEVGRLPPRDGEIRLFGETITRLSPEAINGPTHHSIRDSAAGGRWMSPEADYQGGGSSAVRISHGICPGCYERWVVDGEMREAPSGQESLSVAPLR